MYKLLVKNQFLKNCTNHHKRNDLSPMPDLTMLSIPAVAWILLHTSLFQKVSLLFWPSLVFLSLNQKMFMSAQFIIFCHCTRFFSTKVNISLFFRVFKFLVNLILKKKEKSKFSMSVCVCSLSLLSLSWSNTIHIYISLFIFLFQCRFISPGYFLNFAKRIMCLM